MWMQHHLKNLSTLEWWRIFFSFSVISKWLVSFSLACPLWTESHIYLFQARVLNPKPNLPWNLDGNDYLSEISKSTPLCFRDCAVQPSIIDAVRNSSTILFASELKWTTTSRSLIILFIFVLNETRKTKSSIKRDVLQSNYGNLQLRASQVLRLFLG